MKIELIHGYDFFQIGAHEISIRIAKKKEKQQNLEIFATINGEEQNRMYLIKF